VTGYEAWYEGEGKGADLAERRAIQRMLSVFTHADRAAPLRALEIGCGTGHFSRWLSGQGWCVTGVDISAPMLAEAMRMGRNGTDRPFFVSANALALPFEDRTHDVAMMITSLEFVPDAVQALREAARVVRRGLVLGVLNRWGPLARQRKRSGLPMWQAAHFYQPFELRSLVQRTIGSRLASVKWLTTLLPGPYEQRLTACPIGDFIAMRVQLR
jgi:ubiquinone/menaquinone biosynthesis C-methylase UbiE